MNYDYIVLCFLGSKFYVSKKTFASSTNAEEWAEMELCKKSKKDYSYKVICLN